jgi:hypothetical protein
MGCAGWVLDSNSVAEVTTTADDTIPHVMVFDRWFGIHSQPSGEPEDRHAPRPCHPGFLAGVRRDYLPGEARTMLGCLARLP